MRILFWKYNEFPKRMIRYFKSVANIYRHKPGHNLHCFIPYAKQVVTFYTDRTVVH